MANVKVASRRSKADEAEALAEREQIETSEGRKIVEKDGKKYVYSTSPGGLTIKTRIA